MSERPGFFIPYRYAAQTEPCDYPALAPLYVAAEELFYEFLERIGRYSKDFDGFGGAPPAPRFNQDWFPRLDACAAYTMVRERCPRLIVEIGCGHSTRVMARAVADAGLPTRHVCIDPSPRARLEGLAVEHVASRLDGLAPDVLQTLAAADVLFIDSSHIAVPGSDVDRLVNGILPRLGPGTDVHFHDIFLPHAYPAEWAWRGYNEQVVVAALLVGGAYEIRFASAYVVRHMADLVRTSCVAALPLLPGAIESSLWLRKRSSA